MHRVKDSSWLATVVASVIIVLTSYLNFYDRQPLSWDVFGYYSYLPQTFIQNDPGNSSYAYLDSMRIKYDASPYLYQIHHLENGHHLSHYSIGMAVLYAPFYFVADVYAGMAGYEQDGFSLPYQKGLMWSYYFYIVLGLFVLRKILREYFSKGITALTILVIGIGTNYFHTAIVSFGMPHIYLFALAALLIWNTIRFYKEPTSGKAIAIGVFLGLSVIARPTQVLLAILPFLWGVKFSFTEIKSRFVFLFRTKIRLTLIAFLSLFVIVGFQMVYWKMYAGTFLYNTYNNPGEGLFLSWPHTMDFLFSFRKGWFIYTPVMILALIGLFLPSANRKGYFNAVLFFVLVNIYILSCWSNWWYASSFGMRAMIEAYPMMAIGLAVFIQWLWNAQLMRRILIGTLVVFFICFNLFQTWQMHIGVIDISRMTKDYYFATFGSTHYNPDLDSLLLVNRIEYIVPEKPDLFRYKPTKELVLKEVNDEFASQKDGFVMSKQTLYGPGPIIRFDEVGTQDHVWTKIYLEFKTSDTLQNCNGKVVYTMVTEKDYAYGYQLIPIVPNKTTSDGWSSFEVYVLTPELRIPTDRIHVYLYNPDGCEFIYRNLKTTYYERKRKLY